MKLVKTIQQVLITVNFTNYIEKYLTIKILKHIRKNKNYESNKRIK